MSAFVAVIEPVDMARLTAKFGPCPNVTMVFVPHLPWGRVSHLTLYSTSCCCRLEGLVSPAEGRRQFGPARATFMLKELGADSRLGDLVRQAKGLSKGTKAVKFLLDGWVITCRKAVEGEAV